MNGLEKIKMIKKFGALSDSQKQKLYDTYGKDFVEKDIKRCKLIEQLLNGDDDSVSGDDCFNLFAGFYGSGDKSGQLWNDIKNMEYVS